MLSGISSPTRPWFRLQIQDFTTDTTNPVNIWLEEVKSRMLRVLQESNFYNSIALVYLDLAVFGTSAMLIYEDYEDIIRCYNSCAGEYYLANSERMFVDTCYREMVKTAAQLEQEFGRERVSDTVKRALAQGGAALQQEYKVIHSCEPNRGGWGIPREFPYAEIYFEEGQRNSGPLRTGGFYEYPGIFPRWDIVGNDAYGRSPGMDALPDVKQLQQETLRKGQAIEKVVNPPMVGDISLKNQPASMIPGGVTYVAGASTVGFKAAYQIDPRISEMVEDIREIQERIGLTFHNDLFLMISQLDTVRTATEIDARREEKLVMLGPVLTRFNDEALTPALRRVYSIMARAQLLPPPPPEVEGQPIEISYASMLQEAQRAVATTGIERLLTVVGGMAAIDPQVMDNIDLDEATDEYASLLDVSPRIIRSRKDLAAIREQRAQQEAQATALEAVPPAVDAAKTLSETAVGGGQTALNAMLGGSLPATRPI
jgi:hypothetical protein